jgi:hypothetical protein
VYSSISPPKKTKTHYTYTGGFCVRHLPGVTTPAPIRPPRGLRRLPEANAGLPEVTRATRTTRRSHEPRVTAIASGRPVFMPRKPAVGARSR